MTFIICMCKSTHTCLTFIVLDQGCSTPGPRAIFEWPAQANFRIIGISEDPPNLINLINYLISLINPAKLTVAEGTKYLQ